MAAAWRAALGLEPGASSAVADQLERRAELARAAAAEAEHQVWPVSEHGIGEPSRALALVIEERGCPDCGGRSFLRGPRGGMSENFKCAGCGSRFNAMGPFGVQRISAPAPERE